jgi:transcription elongation factor GreA
MDKVPMTKVGHATLEAELKKRKFETRKEITAAIAEARAHGDLSENAEYHAAKEQQSFNEGRIQELEGALGVAQIIDPSTMSGDTVKFGATVTIADEETDEEKTVQIVGEYEADIDTGKISLTSPIARGLIGKSEGDSVKIQTPKGPVSYEIVEVLYK